jgi:hypothetical protein
MNMLQPFTFVNIMHTFKDVNAENLFEFEDLMSVKILTVVFWVFMVCCLVDDYQYFRGIYCLQLKSEA